MNLQKGNLIKHKYVGWEIHIYFCMSAPAIVQSPIKVGVSCKGYTCASLVNKPPLSSVLQINFWVTGRRTRRHKIDKKKRAGDLPRSQQKTLPAVRRSMENCGGCGKQQCHYYVTETGDKSSP